MSGGTSNFTPTSRNTSRNWQAGRAYGDDASSSSDWSRTQDLFHQFGSLSFRADPDASRSAPYLQRLFEERGTVGLDGFPVPSHSPMQVLVRGGNPSHRQMPQIIQGSSPGFMGQQNVQVPTHDDDSRLTRDEQQTALKKLKKRIYSPPPKKMPKPSLYYRFDTKTILKEMEKEKESDGINCAVCLEEFEPKETVMLTPCNHMFHEVCIVPWVKSHGQCPVCRFAFCQQKRENASANNIVNVAGNDPVATELLAVIRALEEGSIWNNFSRFYQL